MHHLILHLEGLLDPADRNGEQAQVGSANTRRSSVIKERCAIRFWKLSAKISMCPP